MANTTHTQGWTPDPDGRGTISLLWSCLFTLFICTWIAVHPEVGDSKLGMKFLFMFMGLMAPEIWSMNAIWEIFEARELLKRMRKLGYKHWTLQHSFFADMGGFKLQVGEQTQLQNLTNDATKLWWMVKEGHVPVPEISKDELMDRSKEDSLAKAIAVLQAGWLLVQCIARAVQGLPITTLELTTMAFVFCTTISYAAWWKKPKDVQYPIIIKISALRPEITSSLDKVPGGLLVSGSQRDNFEIIAMSVVGTLFGCFHCIAWNWHFPTAMECLLWRVAAVMSTVALPIALPMFIFSIVRFFSCDGFRDSSKSMICQVMFHIVTLFYLLARVYLIVEVFISLRALPSDVYKSVEWVNFLPNIS
ncbi:hypothetical protein CC78DRAFT_457383 [Lojkania enalia]|uniref:Uncharacterized protein n=1 Tax=Lojkania enalia TaxID=147567 RepID=A0A9P4KEU1_9PLEO|nr:hypothetical protein CC78DRAFT_457383 [Didymosphaeria enalia]